MNVNNFENIKKSCTAKNAKLVAVTKKRAVTEIEKLYSCGHKMYGENRVSELLEKIEQLPKDVSWHFIGHLQRKKVKKIIGKVSLIHSVDSFSLLEEIEKRSQNAAVITNVLLQFHIAKEESKYGFSEKNINEIINKLEALNLKNTIINGVMGMATNTDNTQVIESEFETLQSIFEHLKNTSLLNSKNFKEISMGMSGDYKIALEKGSTILRIGSLLFE